MLEGVSTEIRKSWVPSVVSGSLGNVSVSSFSFNHVSLEAEVFRPGGAWLYYADSYHPGWQAFVDGKAASISRANLAFKAIQLEKGKHTVRFDFFDGLRGVASYLIAAFGFLFTLAVLIAMSIWL